MSISSVSNNNTSTTSLYLQPEKVDVRQDFKNNQDPVQLSDQAKQLLLSQGQNKESEKKETGKESVQISSSIGRTSRITGLHREDVAALYRSIDKLT
ncbi:hypothetical protein MUS1_15060 [Marinomonas ushuaiensis DSM 15871]|uniref:Uncharacterized protein n=1 Tax=Marinomonas ushuaiensis DSM 15871 TaxID=1122207 RepID=X7E3C3_9GAMM|nr:hypothetical protein [Marinomonas ushuaiensis]ETX10564.1 hypothetical protein MUS1_15060 [Marinomonas ushuaiensis DSM 15871]